MSDIKVYSAIEDVQKGLDDIKNDILSPEVGSIRDFTEKKGTTFIDQNNNEWLRHNGVIIDDGGYQDFLVEDRAGYKDHVDASRIPMSGMRDGFFISKDGTALLYTSNSTGDRVYQHALSTPFDLNSGSQKSYYDQGNPFNVSASDDGLYVYITFGNTAIKQVKLTSPYDFNAIDSEATHGFSELTNDAQSVHLIDDGYTALVADKNSNIYRYTLSTKNDLGTAVYSGESISVSDKTTTLMDFQVDDSEEFFFVSGFDNWVYKYKLNKDDFSLSYYEEDITIIAGDTGYGLSFCIRNLGLMVYTYSYLSSASDIHQKNYGGRSIYAKVVSFVSESLNKNQYMRVK